MIKFESIADVYLYDDLMSDPVVRQSYLELAANGDPDFETIVDDDGFAGVFVRSNDGRLLPVGESIRPVMVAGRSSGTALEPQSVGEVVSDVAAPLGAMVDMGAAAAKGMAQGFAGLPGDLEGLTRMVINLLGGSVDENTKLPTTEEIKTWLDQFPIARVGGGANPYEKLGEFAAPGGYAKAAKPIVRGAKKSGGAAIVAPTANTDGAD